MQAWAKVAHASVVGGGVGGKADLPTPLRLHCKRDARGLSVVFGF